MSRLALFVLILISMMLVACPSQPTRDKFSDPETAKSASDRSMQEMERSNRD